MKELTLYDLNSQDTSDQAIKDRYHEMFMEHSEFDPDTGCWIYLRSWHKNGVPIIRVGQRFYCAARVAFWVYHGAELWNSYVYHTCDTLACVNPDHLKRADSLKEMRAELRRLGKWGSVSGRSERQRHGRRFNAVKVLEIRSRHKDGEQIEEIARKESVTEDAIRNIIKGVTWKKVGSS